MASRGCSFCGKDREAVRHLVSGPRRVGICDECIEVAAEVAAEALRPHGSDRLLTGASLAVTNDSRRGGRLGIVEDPTVAIQGGRVTWVGPRAETPPMYGRLPELDCEGGMVIPAFADARTLPLADGSGGVDAEEMAEEAVRLVDRMVQSGTAVLQATARPSADPVAVTAQLAILRALPGRLPLEVQPGLRIEGDPVPALLEVASRTATHVTIPVGAGGPPVDRIPAIAVACRRMGLAVRLADAGALTAGLLAAIEPVAVESPGSPADLIPALVRVGSAVVVDGAYPAPGGRPVADYLAAGVPVAIATGCDPDGLAVTSCAFAAWLAWSAGAVEMDDALWCVTRGGALALGDDRRGRIAPGAPGDLLVLDAAEPLGLVAHPDRSPVRAIVREGDVLVA